MASSVATRTTFDSREAYNDKKDDISPQQEKQEKNDDNDDDDDDDEPPQSGPSLWQLPPEQSFSDWTLEIVSVTNASLAADGTLYVPGRDREDENDDTTNTDNNEEEEEDNHHAVVQVYHVHRALLSAGSRKCHFFEQVFREYDESHHRDHHDDDNNHNEGDDESTHHHHHHHHPNRNSTATTTTRIELHPLVAPALPIVLDYLYHPQSTVSVTAETATPVHSLAQLLDCPRLQTDVYRFARDHNITLDNCHVYYQHAQLLRNDSMASLVVKTCARHFTQLASSLTTLPIASVTLSPPPSFWIAVLLERRMVPQRPSATTASVMRHHHHQHAGWVIAHVCTMHLETMDPAQWDQLTSVNFLPHMDGIVASTLLELCTVFERPRQSRNNNNNNKKDAETAPPPPSQEQEEQDESVTTSSMLSNLQVRCIDALADDWLALARAENRHDFVTRLPPNVTAALLPKLLQRANRVVQQDRAVMERLRKSSSSDSSGGGGGGGGVSHRPTTPTPATTTTTTTA